MKNVGLILLLIILTGCSEPNKFKTEFTKPKWFASIEAPKVHTPEEVGALWRSKERCCVDANILLNNNRIFYKSCFNAISEHYENEEMVVKCLWLMDAGAESKQRIQLSRFLVENFSHHKNNITECVNCMPGDTVARETLYLARYEKRLRNSNDKSIRLIETLLDNRVDEISYWVQAEIYPFLGKLYLESGITNDRVKRFQEVYKRFNRVKKYNEPLEKRYDSFHKVYRLVMKESPAKTVEYSTISPTPAHASQSKPASDIDESDMDKYRKILKESYRNPLIVRKNIDFLDEGLHSKKDDIRAIAIGIYNVGATFSPEIRSYLEKDRERRSLFVAALSDKDESVRRNTIPLVSIGFKPSRDIFEALRNQLEVENDFILPSTLVNAISRYYHEYNNEVIDIFVDELNKTRGSSIKVALFTASLKDPPKVFLPYFIKLIESDKYYAYHSVLGALTRYGNEILQYKNNIEKIIESLENNNVQSQHKEQVIKMLREMINK